ncbi:hypothetical protein HDG34_005883 [Paraburkholderia sp. HC6.4b]|uniref:hypothetical protein n=1 Tax=unclassified Paraburkholderia TaxID=2615204 RepID=UPI0016130C56|nr:MULTISPECIES: hypothetical protein [unclassified Paraburkholderia]MBB5411917.1 hypothetical protein [Paraburkholderia sp. HC6.4b]MBB5450229.1 hypothetical protein [Paraburkholderia sp. Kb1A]
MQNLNHSYPEAGRVIPSGCRSKLTGTVVLLDESLRAAIAESKRDDQSAGEFVRAAVYEMVSDPVREEVECAVTGALRVRLHIMLSRSLQDMIYAAKQPDESIGEYVRCSIRRKLRGRQIGVTGG